MPAAARVGDPITHTNALAGVIVGAAVGAVVGLAIVSTGGAAVPLLLAASAAAGGASLGGTIGQMLGGLSTSTVGALTLGSPNVQVNSRPKAYCTGPAACSQHPAPAFVAQGAKTVMVNGHYAARTGDKGSCGFAIGPGSRNVEIGGPAAACGPVGAEVPAWVDTGLFVLGLAGGGMGLAAKGFTTAQIAARLGGSVLGGLGLSRGGHWVGGQLWGEGSWQQTALTIAGGVGGSVLGFKGGAKLDAVPRLNPFNYRPVWGGNNLYSGAPVVPPGGFRYAGPATRGPGLLSRPLTTPGSTYGRNTVVQTIGPNGETLTTSAPGYSRSRAFRDAKESLGVPRSAQPVRVYRPGTPEGNRIDMRPGENVRQWEFKNGKGETVWIREDRAQVFPDGHRQGPHFNAGPSERSSGGGTGGESAKPGKLNGHNFFDPNAR